MCAATKSCAILEDDKITVKELGGWECPSAITDPQTQNPIDSIDMANTKRYWTDSMTFTKRRRSKRFKVRVPQHETVDEMLANDSLRRPPLDVATS